MLVKVNKISKRIFSNQVKHISLSYMPFMTGIRSIFCRDPLSEKENSGCVLTLTAVANHVSGHLLLSIS